MDILIKERTVPVFRSLGCQMKTAAMTMESVVPDTKDDIGRILSVRPEIRLKSKELGGSKASVSAEAVMTVLYVNEAESDVSAFSITEPAALEFELSAAVDPRTQAQIRLSAANIRTRIVNSRKLCVDWDLVGELSLFRREEMTVEQKLPETCCIPVHLQQEELQAAVITSLAEKSFSLNEQFTFSESEPQAKEIIAVEKRFRIRDRQLVGDRLLVKAELLLDTSYFDDERRLRQKQFSVPFSQLIDLESESAILSQLSITVTSDYFDLTDAADGQKMLNYELHALIQVRAAQNLPLRFISDAYSNAMPMECEWDEEVLNTDLHEICAAYTADEAIELPEEFQELLCLFPSPSPFGGEQCALSVDLLCLSREGKLFTMRRTVTLRTETDCRDVHVQSYDFNSCGWSEEPGALRIHAEAEMIGTSGIGRKIRRIRILHLDESKAFDASASPSLTAVWAENESLWEMAKLYHSSPEAIAALNEDLSVRPLFIPKTN